MTYIAYTSRLQAAIDLAERYALEGQAPAVGTNHALVALFDSDETMSRQVLMRLGVTRDQLISELLLVCGESRSIQKDK